MGKPSIRMRPPAVSAIRNSATCIKTPCSNPEVALALTEIRQLVVHIEAIKKDDSIRNSAACKNTFPNTCSSCSFFTRKRRWRAAHVNAFGQAVTQSEPHAFPPALRVGSNRHLQVLDLHWRSPEFSDLWYKSRGLKQTIRSGTAPPEKIRS